ncbi:hypothetical protein LCGC14_1065410 [marine sediment metagenome]|uniref:Uncharacterized protein n=1 Tax=marine sediment metagenome TaxID=412755 RepID=A0A0F9MJV1_9ZZZZ
MVKITKRVGALQYSCQSCYEYREEIYVVHSQDYNLRFYICQKCVNDAKVE